MNIRRYLERIRYQGTLGCSLNVLENLLESHIRTVPFENLDIRRGVPIVLDTRRFYEKIVQNRRGGYCYEINSLFHELLVEVGFEAIIVSARVCNGNSPGEPFDHLSIVVNVEEKTYLADAGFGDFCFKPLLLNVGEVQTDGRNHYRIEEPVEIGGEMNYGVSKWVQARNEYVIEYYFSLTPRKLFHFRKRNEYQQTSPDSHFTRNLICSLPAGDGRKSLINNRLVVTKPEGRSELKVNPSDLNSVLAEHFGMEMEFSGEEISIFEALASV